MSGEVLFVCGYALALAAGAVGLHRLGRVSTDAWSSRLFAAYRAQVPDTPTPASPTDWPHAEAGRLHTAIGAVAAAAGALLCAGEAVRHHRAGELAALVVTAAVTVTVLGRLARRALGRPR